MNSQGGQILNSHGISKTAADESRKENIEYQLFK